MVGRTDLFFMQEARYSMTSLSRQRTTIASACVRRMAVRTACASAVAVLGWSAMSATASAAPGPVPEAPFVQAGYMGLRVGSQGSDVSSLQGALIAAGINVRGGADGVFGPATRQAVIDFQAARGLPTTGEVDQATSNALASSGSGGSSSGGSSGASSSGYVGLRQGARGPAVATVQKALASKGVFVAGGADGVYGPATTTAVKQFQGWNGLTQTGGITIRTAAALGLGGSGNSGGSSSGASTPPPSTSDSSYVGIREGARGDQVKKIQQQLIAKGVFVAGGADGVYGPATTTAVKQFQGWNGLTQTGGITIRTAAALGLGGSGNSGSGSSSNPYVGLTIGSRGDKVAELQRALQNTGVVVRGGADGVFGSATATALKAFQKVNGIPQTGVTTERGVKLLALGSGGGQGAANPNSGGGSVSLERFPVQGHCFFGDTWHAPRGGGRLHVGVDIIANEGNLLYAVADGEITKLFWDQPGALAGNGFRLTEPNGTYYIYLHLSGFAPGVKVGTKVKAGDVIGFVGNTGSSATAHLHFEIHPGGGAAINPYPYVEAIDGCKNTTPQYQSSFS